jgi:hypothetical protein
MMTIIDKLTKEERENLQHAIEESKKDPENICLYYATKNCIDTSCCGYSGTLLCSSYINKRHLEFFQRYNLR